MYAYSHSHDDCLLFPLRNGICGYLYENAENKTRTSAFRFRNLNLWFVLVEEQKTVIMQMRVWEGEYQSRQCECECEHERGEDVVFLMTCVEVFL